MNTLTMVMSGGHNKRITLLQFCTVQLNCKILKKVCCNADEHVDMFYIRKDKHIKLCHSRIQTRFDKVYLAADIRIETFFTLHQPLTGIYTMYLSIQ